MDQVAGDLALVALGCREVSIMRGCRTILRRLPAAVVGVHPVPAAGVPVGLRFDALFSRLPEEVAKSPAGHRGAATCHLTVDDGLFEPRLGAGLDLAPPSPTRLRVSPEFLGPQHVSRKPLPQPRDIVAGIGVGIAASRGVIARLIDRIPPLGGAIPR